MRRFSLFFLIFAGLMASITFNSCKHTSEEVINPEPGPGQGLNGPCDTNNVTYNNTVYPIFQQYCISCHSGTPPQGNLDLTDFQQVAMVAQNGQLVAAIGHTPGISAMPKDGNALDSCYIKQISIWVRDTTFSAPPPAHPCNPDTVYFESDILPILLSTCSSTGCHDGSGHEASRLMSYSDVMGSGFVRPYNPNQSDLYRKITQGGEERMPPPPNNPLENAQIQLIRKWISQGAKNLFCDEMCDSTNVTFSGTIWPGIINNYCLGCHSGANAGGGVHLENYSQVAAAANIPVGQPGSLWGAVSHANGNSPMPKNSNQLSDCKLTQISKWIANGTPNN